MRKLTVILILMLVLLLSACGTSSAIDAPVESQPPTQPIMPTEAPIDLASDAQLINLRLIASSDSTGEQAIKSEELEGIYYGEIYHYNSSDVLITIDGEEMSFRDALLDRKISIEDFVAGMRTDARNGHCEESYGSYLGLTHFIYTYGQYEVVVYDDLWEAPNGESFLVREIWIRNRYMSEFDPAGIGRMYQDENGNYISYRREDWGLTFDVIEVTPTSVRVQVTQSGGQQFGQLQAAFTSSVSICAEGTGYLRTNSNTQPHIDVSSPDGMITMNGTTEFTFDWSHDLGELPSGLYSIDFWIDDIYEVDQIHPFTKNYKDSEIFSFIFEIP